MASDGEAFDVEVEFGRAFERFFETLQSLADLLDRAIPVVIEQRRRWDDVENVLPDLGLPPDRAEEFVAIWESEFGSRRFGEILGRLPPPPVKAEGGNDVEGHETLPQPEQSADYRPRVLDFILVNGSMQSFQQAIRRFWSAGEQIHTIAKSIIVFAVGSLETAVGDIERIRLRKHPGAMSPDRSFVLGDLVKLGDISAVVDEAIDRSVEELCYGKPDDWRVWYQQSFKIDLADLAPDWDKFEELVQRRHVIAHNGGRVSRLYLKRLGVTEPPIGTVLRLEPDYVYGALDQCSVLGLLMLASAWQKLGSDAEHMRSHLNNRSYDGLVEGRYAITLALAKRLVEVCPTSSELRFIAMVNQWIARTRLGEDVQAEVASWDVGPLAPRFRVAKAALMQDFAEVDRLVRAAIESKELSRNNLLGWPLFAEFREQAEFAGILRLLEDKSD